MSHLAFQEMETNQRRRDPEPERAKRPIAQPYAARRGASREDTSEEYCKTDYPKTWEELAQKLERRFRKLEVRLAKMQRELDVAKRDGEALIRSLLREKD